MIKLATAFSGIGAIEQALIRLDMEHKILFACDNGDVEIEIDADKELEKIKSLNSAEEKRDYVNKLYAQLSRKNNFVKKDLLTSANRRKVVQNSVQNVYNFSKKPWFYVFLLCKTRLCIFFEEKIVKNLADKKV